MAGQIKVNQVQLGDSSTATNNFVWQTNVDGSCKLARGNVGATTQDILTVDAAGKVRNLQEIWCVFNGTISGTNVPMNGQGVASVTRHSAGEYTINFTVEQPDANYGILVTAKGTPGVAVLGCVSNSVSPTSAGFRYSTFNTSGGSVDSDRISILVRQ